VNVYVGFLRAVNVGGTGKLPMSELQQMCADLGFADVRTYIASGNVVFSSDLDKKTVKKQLEDKLLSYAGKPVAVLVRTAAELVRVLEKNPFKDKEPKFTMAVLLDKKPLASSVTSLTGQKDELLVVGHHEIYVYYPSGMGQSKLRIPAAKEGTARNMNTIKKMVEWSTQ
jgi:uncharacterized protein (DUF1697 family)